MTVKEQLGKHDLSEFFKHQKQIEDICRDKKEFILLVIDIFNYGYMCGQRRERARYKAQTQRAKKGGK